MQFVIYHNSMLATIMSFFGALQIFTGIVVVITEKDFASGIICVLLGLFLMFAASRVSARKQFKLWKKEIKDKGFIPQIQANDLVAISVYNTNPSKKALRYISELNPSAAQKIKEASNDNIDKDESNNTSDEDQLMPGETKEHFVQQLYDRLDEGKQMKLLCMMDNAINEMHNNGIIDNLVPEVVAKVHDENPYVRVIEKTKVAKIIGKEFILSAEPYASDEGRVEGFNVVVNYDNRFMNSIAICIQGGLEGLYESGLLEEGTIDYKVHITSDSDASDFVELLSNLNEFYDEINVISIVEE